LKSENGGLVNEQKYCIFAKGGKFEFLMMIHQPWKAFYTCQESLFSAAEKKDCDAFSMIMIMFHGG